MKKVLPVALALAAIFIFCFQAVAQTPVLIPIMLEGLSSKEAESLAGGEALIREVKTPSRLTLTGFDSEAAAIRKEITALNPNYLTEVIALVPYTKGAEQVSKLAAALSNLEGYIGIPYWSAQMQKTYDLFDKMTIITNKSIPGGAYLEAEQHMKPFEDYKASYEYRQTNNSLVFQSANLSHLAYKGVRSVSPGGMRWFLYVFQSGSYLVYYGAGAVKAFDMMGLIRDRLKVSFIGRVDAFFKHMFIQLKE